MRDNIRGFGGNPDRITIFGQSTDGISVYYYSFAWTSDAIAQGFFQESGNAFSFAPASGAAAAENWFSVATVLGCNSTEANSSSVLNCMRSKNYTEILTASTQITNTSLDSSVLGNFAE